MGGKIEIRELAFSYRTQEIMRGVSFDIRSDSIFGLVGPNGAGKTTLLNLILGTLKPKVGRITLRDSSGKTLSAGGIGFLPERPYYHGEFRLFEYLFLLSKMSTNPSARDQIEVIIALVGLSEHQETFIRDFSKGMLQRLGLAQSIMENPHTLILDEPMSGLDPLGQQTIRHIIQEINNQGTTILITSHNLYELGRLCHEIGVMHHSTVSVVEPRMLKEGGRIHLEVRPNGNKLGDLFAVAPDITVDKGTISFRQQDRETYFKVMEFLVNNRIEVTHLQTETLSLEEITLNHLVNGGNTYE